MWETLQKRLAVEKPIKGHSVLKVTKADVARFESRHSFALPTSYKDYLSAIGPGQLRRYFYIAGPIPGNRGLDSRKKECQGIELLAEIYDDSSFVARMMPFGDSIAGDIFVWDPVKKRSGSKVEYEIFVLPRDQRKIIPVARDFRSFINKVVFGHEFEDKVTGGRDPEWKIEYVFSPLTKRRKASNPRH